MTLGKNQRLGNFADLLDDTGQNVVPTVATLGAAKALTTPLGSRVKIEGRPAVYKVVAAATGTADDGAYIDRTDGLQLEAQFEGVYHERQWGIVRDLTDEGAKLEAFFAYLEANDLVGTLSEGVAVSNRALTFDTTRAGLIGPSKESSWLEIGASFPSGSTFLTVTDSGRTAGTGTGEQPSRTGNEKAVVLKGFGLSGKTRTIAAHGLYFEGLNDDADVDINIHDFKGKGLAIGHAGASETTSDTMRESTFGSIHIKNCGNINGGRDDAALEIGSANGQAGTNNLWFNVLRIIYPRGKAWKIRGHGANGRTRKINIDTMFLHGNEQLSGNDTNGEAWKSANDLCFTGILGATGTDVATVTIKHLDMIGVETGRKVFVTYTGSSIHVGSYSGVVPATSKYFFFNGAANSSIRNYAHESDAVNDTTSTAADLIEVSAMAGSQHKVHVSGISGSTIPAGRPAYTGAISDLNDEDAQTVHHHKDSADSAAGNNYPTGGGAIAMLYARKALYPQRATIIPNAALTANATNYARIQLVKISPAGAISSIGEVDTSTVSWTANVAVNIPITTGRVDAGEAIGIRIIKSGTGVIVPICNFIVEASPNVSIV